MTHSCSLHAAKADAGLKPVGPGPDSAGSTESSDSHLSRVSWGCEVPLVVWAVLGRCAEINTRKPKAEEETPAAKGRSQGADSLVQLHLPTCGEDQSCQCGTTEALWGRASCQGRGAEG